jgi:hypothetical protein
MERVEVYCNVEGDVCLKTGGFGGEEQIISLTPEQVPLVIRWLKAAMKEACEMEGIVE